MDKSGEYLNKIRSREALSRAILKKIVVENNTAIFFLVTNKTYLSSDVDYAREVTKEFVPEPLRADVNVIKSVPSAEAVSREIGEILKNRFPAVSAFFSHSDVEADYHDGFGLFRIGVNKDEREKFDRERVIDALTMELNRSFCGVWRGEFFTVQKVLEAEEEELPPAEIVKMPSVFPIVDYSAIDGGAPKIATYIADLKEGEGEIAVCGKITNIQERETKNGKPYFHITIDDGSDMLRATYFSKKATLEKVRALKEGDSVCMTGSFELYQGNSSFRAKCVDYGANGDKEGYQKQSLPVPVSYTAVFPEQISDHVQSGLFDNRTLPPDLKKGKFVVFDLETTGLNTSPATGMMDHIIEIGAVKIVNGSIAEKFSSFVESPVKLSKEINALTGISDEMLQGAPDVHTVLADFYKFSHDCALVAHNMAFDFSFIRHYGEEAGYLFTQEKFDTYPLAQKTINLKNYKLNTIADYYGFTFNHHRAFDDAFVTAKIFIELIRARGSLT